MRDLDATGRKVTAQCSSLWKGGKKWDFHFNPRFHAGLGSIAQKWLHLTTRMPWTPYADILYAVVSISGLVFIVWLVLRER